MSIFSENYRKIIDGYYKISATINSINSQEHLACIPQMVENWVNMADTYCDQIYNDRSNRHRKKDANRLGDVCKIMFDDLSNMHQQKFQEFAQSEYTGVYPLKKINGLETYTY